MTGFKNFILRGNLVELAVAVIMAARSPRSWRRSPPGSPAAAGWTPDFSNCAEGVGVFFLNAVISFVILAAVVYFFVV